MRFFRRGQKTEDTQALDEAQLEEQAAEVALEEERAREATDQALARTKRSWFGRLADVFRGTEVTEALWEELPAFATFGVRMVAEGRMRVDQYEGHALALRGVAVGRAVPRNKF